MDQNHEVDPRNMVFEFMVPTSRGWFQEPDCNYLEIDLPGFKDDEVRIRGDEYGHIIVSGERQVDNKKIIHFFLSFKVPENADIEETSAILQDETYYVTIPKKVEPENKTSVKNGRTVKNVSSVDKSTSANRDRMGKTSSSVDKPTSVSRGKNENPSRNNKDDGNEEFRGAKGSLNRTFVLAAGLVFLLVLVIVPVVVRQKQVMLKQSEAEM